MAGRGRGRGRGNLSFDIGHLGLSGQSLPRVTLEPPPTYPPLQQRPTPLSATEVDEYLLALSQEFRGSIRDSPFFLKAKTIKKDIVRFTDRYKHNQNPDDNQWEPDWSRLPAELKPSRKRKTVNKGTIKPKIAKQHRPEVNKEELSKKLENLEAKEVVENSKEKNEEEEEGEEVYEEAEEEFEDDNDYNFDYYNDGGDKYGDDDDGEEGPVY
ncbi:DNA-directed RNA polymerase III subunit RPC7-like [Hydractinia symbiolongicarpus]|uniref:DNA-directed RNA polymerase III subunit RPC7-like n=1 Tax=Hydractinia symbiolongicarpus TaxID=13093 RepID=UPI00254EE803|nr:DNA-directed RNA polymerase III subunit RPC7-like [Hydractinia symbiolongicarpus]